MTKDVDDREENEEDVNNVEMRRSREEFSHHIFCFSDMRVTRIKLHLLVKTLRRATTGLDKPLAVGRPSASAFSASTA